MELAHSRTDSFGITRAATLVVVAVVAMTVVVMLPLLPMLVVLSAEDIRGHTAMAVMLVFVMQNINQLGMVLV